MDILGHIVNLRSTWLHRETVLKKGRREGRKEKNDRNKEVEKGINNCFPKLRSKNMLIFIYDKLGKDEMPAIKWWKGKNNFHFGRDFQKSSCILKSKDMKLRQKETDGNLHKRSNDTTQSYFTNNVLFE